MLGVAQVILNSKWRLSLHVTQKPQLFIVYNYFSLHFLLLVFSPAVSLVQQIKMSMFTILFVFFREKLWVNILTAYSITYTKINVTCRLTPNQFNCLFSYNNRVFLKFNTQSSKRSASLNYELKGFEKFTSLNNQVQWPSQNSGVTNCNDSTVRSWCSNHRSRLCDQLQTIAQHL